MAYGYDDRVDFKIHARIQDDCWLAVAEFDYPKEATCCVLRQPSLEVALKELMKAIEFNLRILKKRGDWPVFIDTTTDKAQREGV